MSASLTKNIWINFSKKDDMHIRVFETWNWNKMIDFISFERRSFTS